MLLEFVIFDFKNETNKGRQTRLIYYSLFQK
jgi:hypothetical protein